MNKHCIISVLLFRVLVPDSVELRQAARQSIPFFINPDNEVMVENLLGETANFQPTNAIQHVQRRFAATFKY